MEKHAFRMSLNPGCRDEYRKRHDEFWSELVSLLREAGILDYSIHRNRAGDCRVQATGECASFVATSVCLLHVAFMADRHARNAGAVFTLKHHLVWCPKCRRKVLTGQAEARPRQLLAEVADEKGMTSHAMEIMPDRVHPFVESDPTPCVAETVNRPTGRPGRVLRQEFPTSDPGFPRCGRAAAMQAAVGHVSQTAVKRHMEHRMGRQVIRSYRCRLHPDRAQEAALTDMLGSFRDLCNAALQQRIGPWRRQGLDLRYARQASEPRAVRAAVPELAGCSFSAGQQVLRRLDKAFAAFFRRVKRGETPGFPRFRAKSRFHGADFRVGDGLVCRDGRLRLVGIPGLVKVRWHRELPARPTHAIISRSCGKWHVTLRFKVRDLAVPGQECTRPDVGIDVGLNGIVATSDGRTVKAPKHARKAQAKTRRLQRALASTRRNPKRRAKARKHLASHHARVARGRRDFLHKLSHDLARQHRVIAMEDLDTDALERSFPARSMHDAAWTQLRDMPACKAESAGGSVALVDPRGTSQQCGGCGLEPDRPKTLADRVHECGGCGLVMDRDVNAARNVLLRLQGPGTGLRSRSVRVAAQLGREAVAVRRRSVHLDEDTNTLFGILWRTDDHGMDGLPSNEIMKRWWAHMADIMETHTDGEPVVVPLTPVFHMP